jgi:plastocyanin
LSRTKIVVTSAVAVLVAIVFASVALARPAAPAAPTVVKPVIVPISGTEFKFTVSRKTLPVNKPIWFKFKNVGDEVHDLSFTNPRKKTAFLTPGKSATLKITFKKKGRYQAICTVGEHFLRGMKVTFVVK